ncbi:DUF4092 domain-containing protein [Photobacterium lutimaris]|uniref:DUF4092 domain-containing protein n=1 Tax=Photobacterium lutimaris TaxID=388278 RepID=A0A2T3IYS5_9GAMM|nr:DUF4092 domain-containing protein [Photobacterium lutimaris]
MTITVRTIPTASCPDGSCLDDDGFTQPHLPTTPVLPPQEYNGALLASGNVIRGEVACNGQQLTDGEFSVLQGGIFSCHLGAIELGEFAAPMPAPQTIANDVIPASFELNTLHGENVTKVLQSISSCSEPNEICLEELDSYDIADIYLQLDNNDAVEQFLSDKQQEATDDIDKSPSSHTNPSLTPAVSGGSNDLNAGFVSSAAEQALAYKPSADAKVLTRSRLADTNGRAISGIHFYSLNSTGVTDENGEFEYLWGDVLTFGIETFEFGSVSGNQLNYQITDVTDNLIKKDNIQALLERYATVEGDTLLIPEKVNTTFSTYPNVINELINLNLPNGGVLVGSDFTLPNEFEAQFDIGLTATIDQAIKQEWGGYSLSPVSFYSATDNRGYVTDSLSQIFRDVSAFHVFNDNMGYYGATGYTRASRALNLSNTAFPIMMARSDINRQVNFGDKQAWTRDGKPYIATHSEYPVKNIPEVSKDNATFGLPFVVSGEIGKGKVVFMGSSLYPSILSCPANYWADDQLHADAENQVCTTGRDMSDDPRNDHLSMKRFFDNLFQWFSPSSSVNVATNIDTASLARKGWPDGVKYPFFIDQSFGFASVTQLSQDGFGGISPADTPILILQAYETRNEGDGMTWKFVADITKPKLSQDDITALIRYIDAGGNVLFMDGLIEMNPEPIGRLADAAGIALGGENVTPTDQENCGSSYYCNAPRPNPHAIFSQDSVVYERFPDVDGKPPFTVNPDGSIDWNKPEDMSALEIPTYTDEQGKTHYARIAFTTDEERLAAITTLQTAFEGVPVCTSDYPYEFNCIETRQGHGWIVRGTYGRADFDRYEISPDVVASMVKAANLGGNIKLLADHEIYYRTKGSQGHRLNTAELNQAFDNLSVWLWNDNPYAFTSNSQDELGFETLVSYLNCYTNDKHGGGLTCPDTLKAELIGHQMLHENGELNPSYPLNYMEKPLTRIMLGRSFWDHDITVDTTAYPMRGTGAATTATVTIETAGEAVSFSAGNMQPTGLWAKQLEPVTVSGGVKATVTVMLADDITGRPQHETNLRRPPRMQQTFAHDGSTTTLKVPYGGLIYIKPLELQAGPHSQANFTVSGVEKAAFWQDGQWVHTLQEATAPIAEIDTGSFVYTAPVNNLAASDLDSFSAQMNRFADAASDFYGRDETTADGQHQRFTHDKLPGFRHHFVNDVQISIGAAHSGYPVMSASFNAQSNTVATKPVDDWLLWHETGHNLAAAPFVIDGSTEVTNNILALYMQELEGRNGNPQMDRIRADIQKVPYWLDANSGHAWAHGDAGIRLVMFGQLKIWAETHFAIDNWYQPNEEKPTIYNADQGWNMFKLMHRKSRGDQQGDKDTNYCSASETGLASADQLMVCASYASGYDLSEFFTVWNAGETSSSTPDGGKTYAGGITPAGLSMLSSMNLPQPEQSPLHINRLP